MKPRKFFAKRTLHLLTALAFFNFGCSHMHRISRQAPIDFADKKVKIVMADSSEFRTAYQVQVASDSVFFYIDKETTMKRRVANTEVGKIIAVNHGRGAVEGLRAGAITGLALVGIAAIPLLSNDFKWEGDGPHPVAVTAVYFAALAGAGFTGVTTIIGAAVGSRDIYEFDEKEDDKAEGEK